MSRKQSIIVSVTGIFLVLLILVGLTYAYFLTKIKGNTNDKSISVTTANLEIEYSDNNDIITGDKIEPGTTLPTKVFTVTNNGNKSSNYSVGLVNIINTFTNTKDVVYTLTCKSYKKDGFSLSSTGTITGTVSGTCSGKDETEFPSLNSYIVNNSIDINIVHAYTITVTYKETGTDQSIDMNKTLEAKIDIFDPKSLTIKGNVTNSSENDYIVIHSKEQESNIINGKYQFIGITPDNHTISIKNRKTTTSKDTTLNVSKGTPNVSSSKIVYNDEKNIADMDINVSNSTITLDVTKISEPLQTLKDTILASAKKGGENRTTMGTTKTEFTAVSGANDRLLNNAPDDYGTSYYYYGAVTDNYVSFADKLWRIVRINGDGTIRLVLDDVAKDASGSAIRTAFNSSYNDSAYVGYMYGLTGQSTVKNQCIKLNSAGTAAEVDTTITTESACTSAGYKWTTTPYDATHTNVVSSTVKKAVDKWYEDNLKTNYANYLSDTLFCNDKTLASNGIGKVTTQLGYGTNETCYASIERLLFSTGTLWIRTSKPTFKCAESATNDYSRFTVDVATLSNGNKTNGNLTYPVGLLTADEVAYAGAYRYDEENKTYYLYNSSIISDWWLLSPFNYIGSSYIGSSADEWLVDYSNGSLNNDYNYHVSYDYPFRPSINLKAETLKNAGDGTKSNPYTVKLS